MVRAWRKAARIMDRLDDFILSHADETLKAEFLTAEKQLNSVMDRVVEHIENKILTELKEQV